MSKFRAWIELIKLGPLSGLQKEITQFYRGLMVSTLETEGWFKFLSEPKTLEELTTFFNYTNKELVKEIIDALVQDNVLALLNGTKYNTIEPINSKWIKPRIFDVAITELWVSYAKAIPNRLKDQFADFSAAFNLYNWDDALANRLYEQIRKSAVAFANALKKPGKFLDVGFGNGYGTAAIWTYYYQRKYLIPNSQAKIYGIDTDSKLCEIAKNEFSRMVSKRLGFNIDEVEGLKPVYPEFDIGSVEKIPFPDGTFDYVYASQVLHWTDAKKAIEEMIRVTKPNGIIFGTQNMFPQAYKQGRYASIMAKVVKGAGGCFSRTDFTKWVLDAGVKKVEFATPITIFKITK